MIIPIGTVVYLPKRMDFPKAIRCKVAKFENGLYELTTEPREYKPIIDHDKKIFMHGTETFVFINVKPSDIIYRIK